MDGKEEIIDKIKNISKKEFQIIETKKDGNCLFYSILKSIKERIAKHTELRQIVCDYIENDDYESDAIFEEEKCKTKYEYIKKLRRNGEYANDITLEAIVKNTNIIIGIYKDDKRYENNPWTIIDIPKEKKIKGIILIHLLQGDAKGTGHYSAIKLFNNHNLGKISFNDFENIKSERKRERGADLEMFNTNEIKILIYNCRSIRDYMKKIFLLDLLRNFDIDVALLQETFLIEEDKLYIEGYKIFRADNQIRRKGVAILISNKLDVDATKLAADPHGRFIKVRIKNREDINYTTISSIYLEPEGDLLNINDIALESNILGGDMNNANTDFNKKGVFHLKNITIEEEIKFENKYLTDHPILIGKSIFRTNKLKNKESIKILNMSNVNANNQKIADFKNNKNPLLFSEPHKTIYIDKIEDKIDIEKFGEEYQKLKDENKIKNKEEWKLRYQNVNSILTQGILSKENWLKINKIILQNKKSKIWRETANIKRITEDFKKLYKHSNNNRNWDHNEIANTIQTIFYIIQANSNIYNEEQKLYSPNSKAMDYNGFSQKIIINSILDQNINKEISNYMELFKKIEKGFDLFLHNKIRTILFKKKEDANYSSLADGIRKINKTNNSKINK